jgi:transposase
MFAVFGGVPEHPVGDALEAGVTKACIHEPRINRPHAEIAVHYGTAVLPARPCRPRE